MLNFRSLMFDSDLNHTLRRLSVLGYAMLRRPRRGLRAHMTASFKTQLLSHEDSSIGALRVYNNKHLAFSSRATLVS